jgi:hypothetical protein
MKCEQENGWLLPKMIVVCDDRQSAIHKPDGLALPVG